jgi:hypothetical protein
MVKVKGSRSRLGRAGDGARELELLPWTAGPGAQKNLDPEHPLARDSKGRSLALLLYSCLIHFMSCRPPSHYVSRTHCRSPAFPHVRALACMSFIIEEVKGSKVYMSILASRDPGRPPQHSVTVPPPVWVL